MNNHNFKWRSWANAVAIVDLILQIIALIVVIVLVFFVGAATQVVATSEFKISNEDIGKFDTSLNIAAITWLLWLVVTIMAISTIVSLWAAVQLCKGAAKGQQANDALKFCNSWRVVCIVFMVLNLLSLITSVWMIVNFFIRGVFLFIVWQFMKELETINAGGIQRTQKV